VAHGADDDARSAEGGAFLYDFCRRMSAATDDVSKLPRDVIDVDVFEQLLDMDEDGREFSQSLVWNYFEQAEQTFAKMEEALAAKSLDDMSTLGHFLKGSSAAVGVIKVRDSCEYIQHYGKCHDTDGVTELQPDDVLNRLRQVMDNVKEQYEEARSVLRTFFGV